MYQVTKTFGHDLGLSACFRQWRAKSHCAQLHGYALSFKLTFQATELDENGWVIDFGSLKPVKEYLTTMFDHKLLVAYDDPDKARFVALHHADLANVQVLLDGVGCEAFAALVFDWVNAWLRCGVRETPRVQLLSVEVREHGANSAIVIGATGR